MCSEQWCGGNRLMQPTIAGKSDKVVELFWQNRGIYWLQVGQQDADDLVGAG